MCSIFFLLIFTVNLIFVCFPPLVFRASLTSFSAIRMLFSYLLTYPYPGLFLVQIRGYSISCTHQSLFILPSRTGRLVYQISKQNN